MESRQSMLLGVSIFLPILPSLIVLWRVFTNVVIKRYYKIADLLIFLAMASSTSGLACCAQSAVYGLGRHIFDPAFAPADRVNALRFIWYAEVLNLLGMFLAKLSIATFLLYLDFTKKYRIVIWSTIALVVICNGAVAMTSILAACDNVALNWDMTLPGKCWPRSVNMICGFVQSCTNMVTDIIYSAVPILYLAAVQLPPRVQWGLRVVFVFGIFATICSIVKLSHLKALMMTKDPTWDSVDLTIWSSAEVCVAIFAACLPPLRSQFDSLCRRFIDNTVRSSRGRSARTESIALQSRTKTGTGIRNHDNDYGSEMSILSPQDGNDGITKTVNVHVVDEEAQAPYAKYTQKFSRHTPIKPGS
ncbi:hypothetical protein AAFC00_001632 [Neodothiora populina]|uniref:Rhodopsin domain-containing protein n=1 Tax=Neodothiora populina TaxID=2781224 RepID=A0ABR3PPM2_9PEZI